LPLEVERVGGGESGVMALYALSALLGTAGQVRVTAWCAARWSRGRAISRGLALMGIAFLPPALAAGHLPPGWALLPLVACTLLLTLGTLAAFPFEMATIADMAGERLVGTYYGVYNLLSGVGILAGNLLAGALVDAGRATGAAGLPWALLAAAGLLSAAAVSRLDRRQRLPAAGQVATARSARRRFRQHRRDVRCFRRGLLCRGGQGAPLAAGRSFSLSPERPVPS